MQKTFASLSVEYLILLVYLIEARAGRFFTGVTRNLESFLQEKFDAWGGR